MAKSIYVLLDDLQTETSVPEIMDKEGKVIRKHFGMVAHTLPREKLPTSEEFESEEKLLAWAKNHGVLHACLQAGIQQRVIDYRAIFKACKKDDVWTPEFGQNAVNSAEWKATDRPKAGSDKADKEKLILETNLKLAQAMSENDLPEDTILNILTDSCGEDMALKILTILNPIDDDDSSDDSEE